MSGSLFKCIQFLNREDISVIFSVLRLAKPGNEYKFSHSKNIFDIFVTGLISFNVISIILSSSASDNSKKGVRINSISLYIIIKFESLFFTNSSPKIFNFFLSLLAILFSNNLYSIFSLKS